MKPREEKQIFWDTEQATYRITSIRKKSIVGFCVKNIEKLKYQKINSELHNYWDYTLF